MRQTGNGTSPRIESKAYKISVSAVLTALAMIFSYVEALFPFHFGIPGIKLGLSNLAVLVALYGLGTPYAFAVNMTRILLSGFLFGGVSAMMYSLAGGLLSFVVMSLLKKTGLFSHLGVSMAGGVAHNLGQLITACLIMSSVKLMSYFAVLLFSGMISGILIGIAASLLYDKLPHLKI